MRLRQKNKNEIQKKMDDLFGYQKRVNFGWKHEKKIWWGGGEISEKKIEGGESR